MGSQSYEIEELEEERRLFYVAVTRAQEKVYLSYANARRLFGGMPMPTVQSRFIHELPEELVSAQSMILGRYEEKTNIDQLKSKSSSLISNMKFTIGDHVEHKLFGKGKILAVEGSGATAKLTIVFSGNVRKKIIAKYANLIYLQVP